MRRIIAGGTGFIGQTLVKRWLNAGHEVSVIGRDKVKTTTLFKQHVQALDWQELTSEHLRHAEIIVNLTGAGIADKRWTLQYKQEILQSRITATQKLATLCAELATDAPMLFSASAIGVYGLQEQLANGLPPAYTEDTPINFSTAPDFLAQVARAWENALLPAQQAQVPVTILRFAVVLDKRGGALAKMLPAFKLGLGGKLGDGKQPFSWISLYDLCEAIDFLLQQKITGVVNLVAPECVTQTAFAKTLASTLHRPCIIQTPAWLLKLLLGAEFAENLLLRGQHVKPEKLSAFNFTFTHPTLAQALKKIK